LVEERFPFSGFVEEKFPFSVEFEVTSGFVEVEF